MENNQAALSETGQFILYSTDDGEAEIKLYAKDGTVWLTQAQICELFQSSKSNISEHITHIFSDGELDEQAVVRKLRTTAADGKKYQTFFYSLDMILAVGFRVRSPRGVQFRKWANTILKDYLIKGYVLDSERLKNPDGRPDYFDELLAKIRDIRASEKRFYQKLRDLFALSIDYDKTDKATQLFFAETQNKLLYGVTGNTAAEIIMARADSNKPNMALTFWQGDRVRRTDIYIAKNYLSADEIDSLNRLVTIFLESAEFRAKNRKTLTLDYWRSSVDKLLADHDVPVLSSAGSKSHTAMKKRVDKVYDEFDARRKHLEAKKADAQDLEELEDAIETVKREKRT